MFLIQKPLFCSRPLLSMKKLPHKYSKENWIQNFTLFFIYQSLCGSFGKKKEFKGSHFRIQKQNFKRHLHMWTVPCTIKQVKKKSPLPMRHNFISRLSLDKGLEPLLPNRRTGNSLQIWASFLTISSKNLLNMSKKSRGGKEMMCEFSASRLTTIIICWLKFHPGASLWSGG